MKVAIDARFLGPEGTGIGRYVENLLNELVEIDKENDYIVLLRKNNYQLFNPQSNNFKKVLTDAKWYSVREQVLVPAILAKEKPDLVHFPHINVPLLWPGEFVLTVHDTTTSEFGGKAASTRMAPVYFMKNLGYKVVINQAIRRADKILVPSNFVAQKIEKSFGIAESKVEVTYEAADKIFLEKGSETVSEGQKRKVLESFGVKEPYLIYVGNLFPYKNVKLILEALGKIDSKFSLVVAGSRNRFLESFQREVKERGLENRVKFTGFVPNEELVVLFQSSVAFVFPSLSEGFGLPGLEAMACGCPVLAADSSSLPEVYGEAAVYFNPHKSENLAEVINEIYSDTKKRNNLIRLGREKVKEYSWRRLAEKTLSVYTQVGAESSLK